MSRKCGSISIFLAVTFLCLIVFVMSVVEVTRYQILRAQAERMVISATQSVLAGYDSALKNEYGLFARNPAYGDWFFVMPEMSETSQKPMALDFKYYVTQNAEQSPEYLHMSLVDKIVFGRESKEYFGIAPLEVSTTDLILSSKLIDPTEHGLDYVKEDMMAYMEMRLPLIALKPILESLSAAEKLGKTTEFIEGKNEQIEKAASIEELYTSLYESIDGAVINKTTGVITISDSNYVNRLMVDGDRDLRSHMHNSIDLGPVEPIYEVLATYQTKYNHLGAAVSGLKSHYDTYIEVTATLDDVRENIEAVEAAVDRKDNAIDRINRRIARLTGSDGLIAVEDQSEVDALKAERAYLSDAIRSLGRTLDRLETTEDALGAVQTNAKNRISKKIKDIEEDQKVIDALIPRVSALTKGYDSYLSNTNNALNAVGKINTLGEELSTSIDTFLANAEQSEEAYISSTYEQSTMELQAIKSSYTSDGEDYKVAGNMKVINSALSINRDLLTAVDVQVGLLSDTYNKHLIGLFKEAGIEKTVLSEIIRLSGAHTTFYNNHLRSDTWRTFESSGAISEAIEQLSLGLLNYEGGRMLDYSAYEGISGGSGDADAQKEKGNALLSTMKVFIDQYSFDRIAVEFNPEDTVLPRGLISEGFEVRRLDTPVEPSVDYDIEAYKGGEAGDDDQVYMTAGKEADGLTGLSHGKEQLLLNEYAVGMFRSFPDKQRNGAETLSGYSKMAHGLETELEYIYTGLKDSDQALSHVVKKIFAVRVAFNAVHLATDGSKRAVITNIATMIAGWWTMGAGTLILSLIIGLLWATVESLVDVMELLRGNKVPLLKTNVSWYTGIEGVMDTAMHGATEIAIAATSEFVTTASALAKEQLTGIESKVTTEVQGVIEEEINRVFTEAEQLSGFLVEDFDQAFYRALDDVLKHYQNGAKMVSAENIVEVGSEGYEVMNAAITTLKDKLDSEADLTYLNLVKAKEEVVNTYYVQLQTTKEVIGAKAEGEIKAGMASVFDGLKEEIDAMAEKGQAVSATFIRNKMNGYSEGLSDKVKTMTREIKPSKSKLDFSMMIPSVSYEMYLRLFMMMDADGVNDRVVRMLDLIDYNLAGGRAATENRAVLSKDLVLSDYVYGVTGHCEFKVDYLFLDLPVGGFKKHLRDDYFTIRVKAVNGYE